MVLRFISDLLSPRNWLIAAAVFLLAWGAVGYHQSQMHAALRLGEPGGDPAAFDSLRRSFLGLAFLMVAMAALASIDLWGRVWPILRAPGRRPEPEVEQSDAFQPIRSQEELSEDDEDLRNPRRVSRVVSRLILGPEEPPTKNRQ